MRLVEYLTKNAGTIIACENLKSMADAQNVIAIEGTSIIRYKVLRLGKVAELETEGSDAYETNEHKHDRTIQNKTTGLW